MRLLDAKSQTVRTNCVDNGRLFGEALFLLLPSLGQLGADNIASAASIAHGAHWACPGCWKETRTAARRALLGTAPKAKKQRRAPRRTNVGTGSKQK